MQIGGVFNDFYAGKRGATYIYAHTLVRFKGVSG